MVYTIHQEEVTSHVGSLSNGKVPIESSTTDGRSQCRELNYKKSYDRRYRHISVCEPVQRLARNPNVLTGFFDFDSL